MASIPFQVINWAEMPATQQAGEAGFSITKLLQLPGLRIRVVEYSAGYLADHWCQKGHIVYCLEGEVTSELQTGEKFTLTQGMMYVVSDNLSSHRSLTASGVKLLIIDGAFLQ